MWRIQTFSEVVGVMLSRLIYFIVLYLENTLNYKLYSYVYINYDNNREPSERRHTLTYDRCFKQ